MCTVSIIRLPDDAIRLACNRDELLTRPPALPPQVIRFGQRRVIMPVDPSSGGTWIAVNNAGLIFAILNRNAPGFASYNSARRSRGNIIPKLVHIDEIDEVTAHTIDPLEFNPFRLLVASRRHIVELTSDGREVQRSDWVRPDFPLMFTSSGLGDEPVERRRRDLFDQLLRRQDVTCQDRFHRHSWPGNLHLSVCMRRADARTVSYTAVTLGLERATLQYHPDAPDIDCSKADSVHSLSLHSLSAI